VGSSAFDWCNFRYKDIFFYLVWALVLWRNNTFFWAKIVKTFFRDRTLNFLFRKESSVSGFQSIFIPAVASINPANPVFKYETVLNQISAHLDNNPLSGCSVFELIILMCYASLLKKNTSDIHFVALYQEYTGNFYITVYSV